MQIVIDIPEEIYNDCKMQVEMMRQEGLLIEGLNTSLKIIIANGTPLPTSHGRLIDADKLEPDSEWSAWSDGYTAYSQLQINEAETIIERED